MDVVKAVILVWFCSITFCSHANTVEACQQLVGRWDGFFTIKDKQICEDFGGCTHNIHVNVLYPPTDLMTPVSYEALVNPSAGIGGAFEITCEQGVIRCLDFPNWHITVSCDNHHSCEVIFEHELIMSRMTKTN